jgi:hypothetical protein
MGSSVDLCGELDQASVMLGLIVEGGSDGEV